MIIEMDNKGFLLNELLISFAISSVILLAIFNTTITLNKKLSNLYVENKGVSQQILFNKKAAIYFSNNELNKVTNTSNKYTFTFDNDKQMTLEYNINEKYITINTTNVSNTNYNERMNLDNKMNINIPSGNKILTCKTIGSKYLVKLKLPINYESSDRDFGIELYNITSTPCTTIGI